MRLAIAGLSLVLFAMPAMADEGRTFVERLPLETPQAAVTGFIEAFNARDFATAYYMLSPEAKQTFIDSYYAYNSARYFNTDGSGFIAGSLMSDTEISDDELAEVGSDTALIFDNILFHAAQNGELPFDLSDAKVTLVEDTGDAEKAVVTVEGAEPTPLRVDAILLYNGDWRIDRIHWTGSDNALKPWGVTQGKVKSR